MAYSQVADQIKHEKYFQAQFMYYSVYFINTEHEQSKLRLKFYYTQTDDKQAQNAIATANNLNK